MAAKRGSHSRSANQAPYQQNPQGRQGSGRNAGQPAASQREAYERAYQRYVQQHGAAGQAQGRQAPYQGETAQQAYQRQATQRAYQQRAQQGGYRQASPYAAYGQQPPMRTFDVSRKKKGHPVRNTIIVLLVILIAVGAFGGFTGYTLYNSAKTVRSDASAVMSEISDLKGQILGERSAEANATANDIAKRAANMKKETSGWEWEVASHVPVYGSDVKTVQDLSNVLDELATDAIVPLVSEVSQVSLKNLLVDGSINVELAQKAVAAVNDAAPVIAKAADAVEGMPDAHLDQINGPLAKAREKLGKLNTATQFVAGIAPTFADMMGANGVPRTYLIVAQNNSEIRSTGGFLGSIGPLYLDNGHISMGDFRTIYDIYPSQNDPAPITDEELAIFGNHVGWQIADSNFIPDFGRVGEIVKYAWERKGYGTVDAVIGVDPVFLQHMLGIAGPITTSNGTVVDGSNAARLLLHEAYYLPTEQQDPFFEEVAARSFAQLMSHLGDVSLTGLMDVVKNDINARRLQVWMVAENEEQAVETLGADGRLSHDEAEPVLGVYFTDESYSKLFWYMNASVTAGEATKNADGSTTYPVTVSYRNMISDEGELSDYMKAHNGIARTPGEMISWVFLSAPAGGHISDIALVEGEFMPEGTHYRDNGSYVSGTMTQATLQGLDFWYGLSRTMPGSTFTIAFNVTTSPNATEPLKIVRTPTAQEVAGW